MPYPDQYGRHPWVERYAPRYSDPFRDLFRWRQGEPPRYWDEEYYANGVLGSNAGPGYRFSLVDPPRIDLRKGIRL